MSLPFWNDELSRQIEPKAPRTSDRIKALQAGREAGCRVYVAMAPTPPVLQSIDFLFLLDQLMLKIQPEVIFWEPINARGTNGQRMVNAGLEWAEEIMSRDAWAANFLKQWEWLEAAADRVGCRDRLHIWTDPGLKGYTDQQKIEQWWHRPTVEKWHSTTPP
jgi:DNA repair photolyase